jgi:hypothetical protein
MKADRRHELHENALAHTIENFRAVLAENARTITAGITVVVAVLIVTGLVIRFRASAYEEKWRRLSQLMFDKPETARESLDTLIGLTRESNDETFSLAALLEQGRQGLLHAQKADSPPDPAFNEKARQAFEEMLRRFPNNPMAFGVAHCGLATVEENLFVLSRKSSHKENAKRHLDAIIESSLVAGLPFQSIAVSRRNELDQTFTDLVFGAGTATAPATPSPSPFPAGVKLLGPDGMEIAAPPIQVAPAMTPPALVNSPDDVEDEPDESEELADPADPVPPATP